jgi:enamine deaminase RidA (YjgF/YER057c/UK114 family)
MRTRIFSWLGREFIELSGEAPPRASVEEETTEIFRRFEGELRGLGLSLENTVRTRLWGRDKQARALGTAARSKVLGDKARASSSSFVSQSYFDSTARVGLDLLAMRPSRPDCERKPVEFEPPRNYLCYLGYDSVVFFSGYTSAAGSLEEQVAEVLKAVAGARAVSGGLTQDFTKTGRLSVFLQRNQKLDRLNDLLSNETWLDISNVEFGFVDGFAGDQCLIEIEATAMIP